MCNLYEKRQGRSDSITYIKLCYLEFNFFKLKLAHKSQKQRFILFSEANRKNLTLNQIQIIPILESRK